MLEFLKIVLFSVISAIAYGILHDQITARISVEYFTLGHPFLIDSDSPTLLAFAWGTVATWWVGLSLGIPLAFAARIGKRPRLGWRDLVRPMMVLLGCSALCALLFGITGYVLASDGAVELLDHPVVHGEKAVRFLAVNFAHIASYAVGSLGGIVLICYVWRMRYLKAITGNSSA
jgi:hypothetical protein